MDLSRSDIKVLIEIYSGKRSISMISAAVGAGPSQVSAVVSRLEKKKLCRKKRNGKRIDIEMADNSLGLAFRRLIINSRPLMIEKFLYGIRLRILSSCLYEAKTTEEISLMLNLPRKSVQNVIPPLLNRQILKRKKQHLIFEKKAWPFLFDFLDACRNFSLNGSVLWRLEDEVLFEVRQKEEIKGSLTGFSAYVDYGVPVINVKHCCYMPRRTLSKTEIFIHSLLQVEDDARLLELAVVFFRKNKIRQRDAVKIAARYDLRKKIQDFLLVLKSKDEKNRNRKLSSCF